MYEVLIYKKVVKGLSDHQKKILTKFALVIETLKTNPVPWKEFHIKKLETQKICIE